MGLRLGIKRVIINAPNKATNETPAADYGPNEMKEVSEWVRQAAPKYRKRKETKEKAYLEMDNYYYLAISPHECTNLDDWLPKALNQLLGIQAFQKCLRPRLPRIASRFW